MSKWAKNKNGILIPNREAGFIQPGIGLMNKKQGGSGGDPYWNNVVSLCHCDGVNGSTSILDEVSGRVWSVSGTCALDSTQAKFGNTSLFTGNGGMKSTPNVLISSTYFTLECFVYLTSISTFQDIISFWVGAPRLAIYPTSITGTFGISNNVSWHVTSPASLVVNTWIHLACSCSSGVLKLFMNGVLYNTSTMGGSWSSGTINVGKISSYSFTGWIDEIRITNGIGRYSSAFPPPTAPFPNHS